MRIYYFLANILIIFSIAASFTTIDSKNDYSVIPKNIFEAISLINRKNQILKEFNNKTHLKSDVYEIADSFSLLKHAFKTSNNLEAGFQSRYQNLTTPCNLQFQELLSAITSKEKWALQGKVYIFHFVKMKL